MHTWSLAIEEQWYVLWPLAVVVALKVRPAASTLVAVTFALALSSAAWMAFLYEPGADPSRVYYGTDTRAQSLLVGAFLALALRSLDGASTVRSWPASLLGAVALAVLITSWSFAHYDTPFLYRGGFLLLAFTTTALIAAVTLFPRSALAGLLGSAPLRGLGLISYGVYLWHWPLFIVLTPGRLGIDGYALFAVRVAATVAVAAISYNLAEQPIRRGALARLPRRSWMLAPAGAAAVIALIVLVTRAPGSSSNSMLLAGTDPPPVTSASSSDIRLLVVGDSVAFTAGQGLGRVGKDYHLSVWNQGRLGCGVLRGDRVLVDGRWTDVSPDCSDWPERWKTYVDLYRPDAVVVLAGAWDVQDREVDGAVLEFGSRSADEFARQELQQAVGVLSSGGARVFLLTTPHFKQQDLELAGSSPRFDADRIARLNALYEDVAAKDPAAEVVDLASFLAAPASDLAVSDNITSDGVHFTDAGADLVASWLSPRIAATVTPQTPETVATTVHRPTSASRWLELLAAMPDTPETRHAVAMNDYGRFREIFALESPAPGDQQALLEDRARLMFDRSGQRTGLSPSPASGIIEATVALSEAIQQDAWSLENEIQFVRSPSASDLDMRHTMPTCLFARRCHAVPGPCRSSHFCRRLRDARIAGRSIFRSCAARPHDCRTRCHRRRHQRNRRSTPHRDDARAVHRPRDRRESRRLRPDPHDRLAARHPGGGRTQCRPAPTSRRRVR